MRNKLTKTRALAAVGCICLFGGCDARVHQQPDTQQLTDEEENTYRALDLAQVIADSARELNLLGWTNVELETVYLPAGYGYPEASLPNVTARKGKVSIQRATKNWPGNHTGNHTIRGKDER